jgi:hypothetical protein
MIDGFVFGFLAGVGSLAAVQIALAWYTSRSGRPRAPRWYRSICADGCGVARTSSRIAS